MAAEESRDPMKGVDWKSISETASTNTEAEAEAGQPVKKRIPKRIRQIPESYFLPKMSKPSAIAFYGAWIAGGIGAGMLAEVWINKKIKEDGGVIWEFDK